MPHMGLRDFFDGGKASEGFFRSETRCFAFAPRTKRTASDLDLTEFANRMVKTTYGILRSPAFSRRDC